MKGIRVIVKQSLENSVALQVRWSTKVRSVESMDRSEARMRSIPTHLALLVRFRMENGFDFVLKVVDVHSDRGSTANVV